MNLYIILMAWGTSWSSFWRLEEPRGPHFSVQRFSEMVAGGTLDPSWELWGAILTPRWPQESKIDEK